MRKCNVKRMRKRLPQLLRSAPNDRSMAERWRAHTITPHFAYWVRANEGRMSSSSSSFARRSQTAAQFGFHSTDYWLVNLFCMRKRFAGLSSVISQHIFMARSFSLSLSFYRSEMSRNRNVSGFTMLKTATSSAMKSGHGQAKAVPIWCEMCSTLLLQLV